MIAIPIAKLLHLLFIMTADPSPITGWSPRDIEHLEAIAEVRWVLPWWPMRDTMIPFLHAAKDQEKCCIWIAKG